jgi:hypothetical protein
MKLAAALLLAVIVAVSSTSAEALSIVNAEATLDSDASAVNGLVTANAGAHTIADGGVPHVGEVSASVSETFWFHGTGTGSLVVTIPYQLTVTSLETGERDLTRAAAGVIFDIGPGVSGRDFMDADAITLDGGA